MNSNMEKNVETTVLGFREYYPHHGESNGKGKSTMKKQLLCKDG